MSKADLDFDRHMDMMESLIKKPDISIEHSTVAIPIEDLGILPGNSLYPSGADIKKGKLIFENVSFSKRTLSLYTDDKRGFSSKQTIIDGPFESSQEDGYLYIVEGECEQPPGWLHWEIEALSYHIEAE